MIGNYEKPVFVIAEAGINHNGELKLAQQLVEAAKDAGADAVKFQSFRTEHLVTQTADLADYQKNSAGSSQFEMLQQVELSKADHLTLIEHCRNCNIEFLSSPFDRESIGLLAKLGMKKIKIPSGEITNLPYLRDIGALGKEVILSTGMAELAEIGAALEILVAAGTPQSQITVLHCNTEYPTPYEDVHLRAMQTIAEAFGVAVGYSDHTPGIEVPIAATALGASVIEKHLTLDRSMPGPDHQASLEPSEFVQMVSAIRNIENALGSPEKRVTASEAKNRIIARKILVAARRIEAGEPFTEENIAAKRAACEGLSPMEWDRVIGSTAPCSFDEDQVIKLDD